MMVYEEGEDTKDAMIKNKTVSTRVTSEKAKENLAKQGLNVSEYMQLSLIKVAN